MRLADILLELPLPQVAHQPALWSFLDLCLLFSWCNSGNPSIMPRALILRAGRYNNIEACTTILFPPGLIHPFPTSPHRNATSPPHSHTPAPIGTTLPVAAGIAPVCSRDRIGIGLIPSWNQAGILGKAIPQLRT